MLLLFSLSLWLVLFYVSNIGSANLSIFQVIMISLIVTRAFVFHFFFGRSQKHAWRANRRDWRLVRGRIVQRRRPNKSLNVPTIASLKTQSPVGNIDLKRDSEYRRRIVYDTGVNVTRCFTFYVGGRTRGADTFTAGRCGCVCNLKFKRWLRSVRSTSTYRRSGGPSLRADEHTASGRSSAGCGVVIY